MPFVDAASPSSLSLLLRGVIFYRERERGSNKSAAAITRGDEFLASVSTTTMTTLSPAKVKAFFYSLLLVQCANTYIVS